MTAYRWITLDNGRSVYRRDPLERGPASDLPSPMLVRDQMDPLQHMHDGKTYESKSEFRAVTKASGGEELGNDCQTPEKRVDMSVKHDVGEAVSMLKAGYKPEPAPEAKEGWS